MMRGACVLVVLSLWACSETPVVAVPAPGLCGGEACPSGSRCEEATMRCVLDEGPTLRVAGPQGVVVAEAFEVTGVVSDDGEDVELSWRVGPEGDWAKVTALDDGSFSFAVATAELDAAAMVVTVRADDGETQVEQTVTVEVDRVAPTLELVVPGPGEVSRGDHVNVTVRVGDGSGRLQALVVGSTAVAGAQVGEATVAVPLPAGDRSVTPVVVYATDAHGNEATRTFTLEHDSEGPALRFLSPTAQTPVHTGAVFQVRVVAADLSRVEKVKVTMAGVDPVLATPQSAGLWTAGFAIPETEGQVTFSVEAFDAVGNVSTLVSEPLRIDRVAPRVEVVGPDQQLPVARTFLAEVSAGPDAVSVSATFGSATVPLALESPGRWSGAVPLTVTGDWVSFPLQVTATDAYGNARTSASWPLFVDTVAPRIVLTSSLKARFNAADFVTRSDVYVSWRVEDGGPYGRTRSLLSTATFGAAPGSSSNDEAVFLTDASDDGRTVRFTVVGTDGVNEARTDFSFIVDRRAPTITSWLPAAGERNVEPRRTSITFSEPVFGGEALSLAPAAGGAWDAAHTSWTSTELPSDVAFNAAVAVLQDAAGNPLVLPADRQFHTALAVPTSGTVLATNVQRFKAASDQDGALTVGVLSVSGYAVYRVGEVGPVLRVPPPVTSFELNAWARIDPSTLGALRRVGSSFKDGDGWLTRHEVEGLDATPLEVVSGSGAVLSMDAVAGEPGGAGFGGVFGTTYSRAGAARTLPLAPTVVAQARGGWAGFAAGPSAVSWLRYVCTSTGLGSLCSTFSFSAASSAPSELRAVLHPAGTCVVATWDSAGQRNAVFQPLTACPLPAVNPTASCTDGALTPTVRSDGLRVAPFQANGEQTMIASYVSGGVQLGKLTDSRSCAPQFTALGAPLTEPVLQAEPVQVGNRAALLYIDAAHSLKLYVP